MKMKYDGAVGVEHVELADPENQERFANVLEFANERDLAYPLVAVNGQLRLAGSAQYYRVLPLVEALIAETAQPLKDGQASPAAEG
jgi:hypothetical protein